MAEENQVEPQGEAAKVQQITKEPQQVTKEPQGEATQVQRVTTKNEQVKRDNKNGGDQKTAR